MFSSSIDTIRQSSTQIWDFLTRPSPSVRDSQTRQQSRLLASMLLAAMLVIFFLILFSTQTSNALSGAGVWLVVSIGLMVTNWGAYLLTRKGHVQFAVSALLISASTGIFVPALVVGGAGSYNSLFYLFTVILFACTFLQIRTALFGAVIHLLLLFMFRSNFSSISADAIISGPFSFNLFVSVFMLLLSYHQRRSAQERRDELLASEERYRIVSGLISDYANSLRVAPNGNLVHEWITDDSFKRVTGYTYSELDNGGKVNFSLYLPEDEPELSAEIEQTLRNEPTRSEHRIRTKNGDVRWVQIARLPVWDVNEGRVTRLYGVAQDITKRKQAELALVDSEQRYRKISELISGYAFYIRINEDGTMVREWITDSFSRVTGYLPEEINANSISKLYHPDSLAQIEADHQHIIKGESTPNDYRIMTKQGAVRWLHLIRQPAWDEAHTRVIGFYGVARDVTEHKQIEAQKIKLMLEQEQFTMLGHLVKAVSHDFRTALATIETSRYLTEHLVGDAVRPIVQPKLDSIHRSVKHMAAQLEHLYMVSFLTRPSFTPCNLNTIVSGIISDQYAVADQKQIKLIFKADDHLPIVPIDAIKIEQAIRNLVSNALSHTPANGSVSVTTRHTADEAIIEVQDTGSGMAPEIIEHIFEPFFRGDTARTVEKGGVGLGLTIVKMIVEAHGGTVMARSQADMGSVFVLNLPLKEAIAASA